MQYFESIFICWVRATSLLCLMLTGLLSSTPAHGGGAQDWPILIHDIQARVDPSISRLEVVDLITLSSPPDPARSLHLLLHRDLALESVRLGDISLEVEEGERFQPRHFWDKPDYERLGDYAIAREITVSPPVGGWPDEPQVTIQYAGAVYDSLRPPEVAYSRGFETTSGLIDERGAYLAGSTFWIPWSGEQTFRYRLEASVPTGWESVSQGTWDERRVDDDGRVISTWRVENPMSEAYLIAGPYVVREKAYDGMTAYTFTYENTPEDLCRTYLDATGDYLDMYEEMLGPYPFDKFAMVENWWQTGFGMPGFTLLGDRVIRLPFIVHTSYGHEILHNWWGNGVFVNYEEGNWCEGLTTYLADYTYKAIENDAAARDYRLKQLQGYLDYASSGGRDFPLRKFTERESPSTQSVGYGKTMMVFHMVRRLVGDEVFFGSLQDFYGKHLFKKATWDDVVASFEHISEASLTGWFEQWIGQAGAPVLSVTRDESGDEAIVLLQEEPVYEMQVPIRYQVDGELRERDVNFTTSAVRIDLDPGTEWVAVDPGFDIFRKLHRGEIPPSLSQVLGADSTVVVLGSRASPEVAGALRELAEKWSANHDQIIVEEAEFSGTSGRGVWVFGDGELADRLFSETNSFGEVPRQLRRDSSENGLSLVASFRDAEREEIPWTVVLPADGSVVEALGRKLPHYGGYSYLTFDGETNVEKGRWVVETSPLRLVLTEE